ncbi:zeta toxin family protein [Asticcacaulis benevestitus]|uniref:zeta toxin family protein n=1 Tax=Asticcacaulis benevestitus TaxID=347481 RepID=UPI001F017A73|nr:zeta toxin family protein [Asticcacaulis benevestitus]
MIASGLSPFAPGTQAVKAGRLFLAQIEACIDAGQDFAFETTLAGRNYLKLIERLKTAGWKVDLYYIALPSVEMSKARVAERVAHGGHDIPVTDIERRFPRSLRNLFNEYRMKVRKCVCYMNDDADDPPLVFWNYADDECEIFHHERYERLLKLAGLS